jgi:type IV secretory pathway VirB2 component (pilin)
MTFFRRKLSGSRIGALLLVTQAFLARSYAAPAGGGLPWEKPMTLIATSLTGPVAYAIGLIGICIAGGTLLFGHELGEVGRRACMIGLVVAVLSSRLPCWHRRSASAAQWSNHGRRFHTADRADPPFHQPAQPIAGRGSGTGIDHGPHGYHPGPQLGLLVGRLPGGDLLDRCRRCPAADGKSRSHAAAGLRAAHPLPAVLSGQERAAFDLRAGEEELEVDKYGTAAVARTPTR